MGCNCRNGYICYLSSSWNLRGGENMTLSKRCSYGYCSTPIGLVPHKSWIANENYCMYCETLLSVTYSDPESIIETRCTVREDKENRTEVCKECE